MIIKNIIYLNGDFFYISHLFLILGEGYRLGDGSMTNPKDTCYKCPNGTYNRDIIDTAKMAAQIDNQLDVCASIDCSCGHGRLRPSLTLLCQIIFLYVFVILKCKQFDKNSYILQFIDMVFFFFSIIHVNEMFELCWVFVYTIYFLYQLIIWYIIYITVSILLNVCILDGTIIENDDTCQKGEEEKICICDREHLFYGWDPLACQMMEDQSITSRIKSPGNELTNSGNILVLYMYSVLYMNFLF